MTNRWVWGVVSFCGGVQFWCAHRHLEVCAWLISTLVAEAAVAEQAKAILVEAVAVVLGTYGAVDGGTREGERPTGHPLRGVPISQLLVVQLETA